MTPKFPNVEVQLSGEDENVFAIMSRVSNAMRKARVSQSDIDAYRSEIFNSKSYDEALRATTRWVKGR